MNGTITNPDYEFKNNDKLTHKTHRYPRSINIYMYIYTYAYAHLLLCHAFIYVYTHTFRPRMYFSVYLYIDIQLIKIIFPHIHRHEASVFGELFIVGQTENLVAVNKPSSLPMQPCGGYRYNSLEYMLRFDAALKSHLIGSSKPLHIVHRLDR